MVVILPYCIKAKRCEHNALGYWSGLALCLTKVRSSRARCPATALISYFFQIMNEYDQTFNPNVLIGHYDPISWFSDFALYLGTQLVYEQTSFTLCLRITRPLTLK